MELIPSSDVNLKLTVNPRWLTHELDQRYGIEQHHGLYTQLQQLVLSHSVINYRQPKQTKGWLTTARKKEKNYRRKTKKQTRHTLKSTIVSLIRR